MKQLDRWARTLPDTSLFWAKLASLNIPNPVSSVRVEPCPLEAGEAGS